MIPNCVPVSLVAFGIILGLCGGAFAKGSYQSDDELGLVKSVLVVVEDNTKDGCLPQPNALKTEAELILRRSGIAVVEQRTGTYGEYTLVITPFGFETYSRSEQGLGCTVNLGVELWRVGKAPEGHGVVMEAYVIGGILVGGDGEAMADRLRTATNEFVTDLANEILKSRGK